MAIIPLDTTLSSTGQKQAQQSREAHGQKIIRDHLRMETWLLCGAVVQSILFLLPMRPTFIAAPAIVVLLVKAADTLLITVGWKKNPFLAGTIGRKFTALIPESDGTFGGDGSKIRSPEDKARDQIAVLHLGFQINHPLGILAPGAVDVAKYFQKMTRNLEDEAATNGYLGSTSYLGASDPRVTKSAQMIVFYFRSLDDIHKFAHGPAHREGWTWWDKTVSKHRHLAIMHEVYEAPKGRFENVYMNFKPVGFAETSHPVLNEKGETQWMSPVVDASRGKLAGSVGRCNAYGV